MPVSGGATSTASAGSESQENLFWQSIMNSTTAADFEAYLRQFLNGISRVLAQNRLAALRGSAGGPAVTASATGAAAASRVESRAPQPPRQAEQGRPSGISAGQTCAGKPQGAACWIELANQPECYVLNFELQTDQTVTWTEECVGGLAQGTGTLTWVWGDGKNTLELTGRLQDGKMHGRWVVRQADGDVLEGPYVDGKRHGDWVLRLADGTVQEGPFVEGKKHGRWVLRVADGGGIEGPYVDDKKHGRWVERFASGNVWEWPYVDGTLHGRGVMHFADGSVREGTYVDDKQHGRWVWRWADGNVEIETYVNGEKQ